MNLVSLIGRVVKEVEVQQLQPSGKSVFNNTIAVQNVYRNSDDSYHSEVYVNEVVIEEVYFLERKHETEEDGTSPFEDPQSLFVE